MTPRLRRRLFHVASIVLAVGLLYLAFRNVNLAQVADAFRAANYWWMIPLVGLLIGANVLRAWRWLVMVDALPDDASKVDHPPRAPFGETFGALMVGYMVNYVAPRMGEVARTANLSARTQVRFSSLFGTVVSERIVDTAVLAGAVGSAFLLLLDRLPLLYDAMLAPFVERLESIPVAQLVWIAGGVLLVTAGGARWFWHRWQDRQSLLRTVWTNTIQPALVSFRDGMLTLVRSPRRGVLLASTVGMWLGYLLLAYLPFPMLGLAAPYGIGLLDAWILMALGALGLLVPAPGGLGSYHYITILALGLLYDMPEAQAATYAVLTHAAQMAFYTLAGLLTLAIQGVTGTAALQGTRPPNDTAPQPEPPTPEQSAVS